MGNYLPEGSIVTLKGSDRKMVIKKTKVTVEYDYLAVPYPDEGCENGFMFDKDAIENIVKA